MLKSMTDQQLADAMSYIVLCYKGIDEEKFRTDIEAWYKENDPREDLPHWSSYQGHLFKNEIKRGLVLVMQNNLCDRTGCGLKAFAHVLNKAGDSWISDEEMHTNMEYLAWCYRCLSIPDFVNIYAKSYGCCYREEATRIVTDMFRDYQDHRPTCFIVEVASTLIDDVASYGRCVHALNPARYR